MRTRGITCLLVASASPAVAHESYPSAQQGANYVGTNVDESQLCDGPEAPANSDQLSQCEATSPTVNRGEENVILQANDAFGFSSGKESIGLYSMNNVRGFSPIAAGNVRINGLYFDQVFGLTNRVRESTSVRVGLAAHGRPFPAPTGMVDYQLYKPGADNQLSTLFNAESSGTMTAETDFVLPLGSHLSIGGGIYVASQHAYDGTTSLRDIQGLITRWSPDPQTETSVFWTRSSVADDERAPRYIPAGSFLPPRVKRGRFSGPDWAEYNSVGQTYGATMSHQLGTWLFKVGLFRSRQTNRTDFTQLYPNLERDGTARQVIIADPPTKAASTSGELRLSKAFAEGSRRHVLSLGVWARDRDQVYGGGETIDFGTISALRPPSPSQPSFSFGEQSFDAVHQWSGGLSYRGTWGSWSELNVGVAQTRYTKRVELPASPPQFSRAHPTIYYGALSLNPIPALTLFASTTRGLEESGVAPENAVNRNEPLPAILTSQKEVGVSFQIATGVKIHAGAFELEKPYYNLNQQGRFTLLGEIRNRGLEFSVAGGLGESLNLVAGALLLDPTVSGEAVRIGRVGPRPVGLPRQTLTASLDWKPDPLSPLSFDLSVAHSGDIVATRDNLLSIPARTLIDVGARYRFKLFGTSSTIRVRMTNVTDEYAFQLRGAGAYDIIPGRVFTLYIASNY